MTEKKKVLMSFEDKNGYKHMSTAEFYPDITREIQTAAFIRKCKEFERTRPTTLS